MITIDELIAEYEKDPMMKKGLDDARKQLAQLKASMSNDEYRDYILSHLVSAEELAHNAQSADIAEGNRTARDC